TLKDPIREEVKEAMKICRRAGIRPIIVTGDHKLTAKAVAEELGFKVKRENILEGKDLNELSDKDFEKILDKIQLYTRVEPKHKMRIIKAWQERGEVVAMTGDGINDAPALKKADIGVALGSGTEVAKETSDLILLNDSFSIIVAAVEEGRAILDNIRKVITYLLSDSFTEVILIGVSILVGAPLPITATQILWVNLIEDGLPDIALAFEPKEKDLMEMKPVGHKVPLLTREMKAIIFIIGLITDLILLGLFFWFFNKNYDIAYIRTMIFACLSIDSLFYVFSCKSLRRNLWHINPFSNKILVGAVIIGIVMLLLAIYLPLFQILLKTISLNFQDWSIIIGLGLSEIILIEATKWYFIVRHQTEL
ncbi:MAG: cation-translocating P-type ATPase, partial [Candidatus Paceibacterales bacterium]